MDSPKILYVEDDPKSRLIIRKLLENAGCTVYEAVNGKEGVEQAQKVRPDAILMDIMLPVMDGLEAAQKIKETDGISHIPIIALTAKAMTGDQEHILASGCDEYISKPIDLHLLLDMLSQILQRELTLQSTSTFKSEHGNYHKIEDKKKKESASKTILLVDDNPRNLIVLQKFLESEGYNILTAPHGRQALQILKEYPVDLIISDIVMPVMDGYQLCYEVMRNSETRKIHFIFYSSHFSSQSEVDFGLKLGADTYLLRPLNLHKMAEIVNSILHQKIARSPIMSSEEFQTLHTSLLTSKILEIVPTREPFQDPGFKATLEPGRSYLIEEKISQESYDLFLNQLSQGFSGLCLTRIHPKFIKGRYNLERTPFIWLSATKSENYTSSIDLTELSLSIKKFVSTAEESVVLIDGIEFLASKMSFRVVLEFLQTLNEFISGHVCILLIPVDPEALTQRELSLLKRELVGFS